MNEPIVPWYLKATAFATLISIMGMLGVLALYPWGLLDYRTTMDIAAKGMSLVMILLCLFLAAWIVAISSHDRQY